MKQEVGRWYERLELDPDDVTWTREQTSVPESVCSQPCGVGEVKITQQVGSRPTLPSARFN